MLPATLSVVVPVYQGARHLTELVGALADVRNRLEADSAPVRFVEAFFVDDAAIDQSAAVLAALQAEHSWMTIIHLSRNFGQHPATIAGILHCSGDWIASLDEDLQHDPGHLVPLLQRAICQAADVVYAKPLGPVHKSWRDLGSVGFKSLMSRLTGDPHVRDFNSFRMMRGGIARAAAAVCAHDPYFDVALSWFTDRIATLPVEMTDRRYAEQKRSGYTLGSLGRHAGRMLASSRLTYLRLGSAVGVVALAGSILMSLTVVGIKLLNPAAIQARGWVSLVILISFFGGLVSLLAGILVELTSSLVARARGKTTFFAVDRSGDAELLDWAQKGLR